MKDEKMNFEEAMKSLESIVDRLEHADLSLDESIEIFQEGVALSKFCAGRLDEVEKKITVLLEGEKDEIVETELEELTKPEV